MKTKQVPVADVSLSEERAIRDLVATWLAASEKGDLTTMLNLLADDVIFMVLGKEPFGKETFAQNYEQLKNTKMRTTSDIQEIKILGEWAWMRNFLRVTFTPKGGESIQHSGYVLTILRKNSDDKWMIARDANLLMPESGSQK